MTKKYFITGGAGFIANTIIRNLLPEGHEIVVYDSFHRDTLSKSEFSDHPKIKVIKGDVLDLTFLKESMNGVIQ